MRKRSRRNVLGTAGFVLGGGLFADKTFAETDNTDSTTAIWPQLQFNAAKTGNADTAGPSKSLHTAWRFQNVGKYGCASAPAIADETLYFVSNDTGYTTCTRESFGEGELPRD